MPESPSNSAAAPRRITLPHIVLALGLVLFALRAFDYFVPAFFGIADEHGYLTTAKRLATTGRLAQHQKDPYAFIGETMMQSPNSAEYYYLRQPIGYPILCAIAYAVGGPSAPFVVNPLCALALIVGVYVLGRQLKNPLAGALAAVVLAAHPVVLYYTIKPLAHIPDMAIGTWLMIAALAWKKDRKLSQAALVGLALSMAIFIRYANVLLVLPLAVILFDARKAIPTRRLLFHAGAASTLIALALAGLLFYHQLAFGHPLRTGYSIGGNAAAFSMAYFMQHAPGMWQCLSQPGTGLTVLLAAVAAGMVILAVRQHILLAILLAWAFPILILNTAYYGMPKSNSLLYARFALASYVPLLLLAFCWQSCLPDRRKVLRFALQLLAAGSILWSNLDAALELFGIGFPAHRDSIGWSFIDPQMMGEKGEATITRNLGRLMVAAETLVHEKAPPGSIILADNFSKNPSTYFLDYIGDRVDTYTIYSPDMFDPQQVAKRVSDWTKPPPHEFDPARTRQIQDLLGNKTAAELDTILREKFRAYLEINRPVFVLAKESEIPGWKKRLALPMTRVGQNEPLHLGLYQLSPAAR